MKWYSTPILIFIVILTGCSGSEVYQGTWKATDSVGNKFEIDFEPKSFTVKDANGKVKTYSYTQNSVTYRNGQKTYGIRLGDGRIFKIHFPLTDDTGKGAIMTQTDNPLYTICRTEYIAYNDLYNLME